MALGRVATPPLPVLEPLTVLTQTLLFGAGHVATVSEDHRGGPGRARRRTGREEERRRRRPDENCDVRRSPSHRQHVHHHKGSNDRTQTRTPRGRALGNDGVRDAYQPQWRGPGREARARRGGERAGRDEGGGGERGGRTAAVGQRRCVKRGSAAAHGGPIDSSPLVPENPSRPPPRARVGRHWRFAPTSCRRGGAHALNASQTDRAPSAARVRALAAVPDPPPLLTE